MASEIVGLNKEILPWATFDPYVAGEKNKMQAFNLLGGKWISAKKTMTVVDPMNGDEFIVLPDTSVDELEPFVTSLKSCPKTGLHNIFKNPERFMMWGNVSAKMACELQKPEVVDFFTRVIQRSFPKHYLQAQGEVTVCRTFLENFSGDNVRFAAKGFFAPGNHLGQRSQGFRWPFGPVAIISPFNFPLEIPVLQLMGALYMGNKVTLKAATTTAIVMEQWLRMMHYCGAPATDCDFLISSGKVAGEFISRAQPRVLQFTGSSVVGEQLAAITHGKIRLEDAGFDWKVLGPDVSDIDYVAWQCDQDAYASSGQKCSAESILFVHENWEKAGIVDKLRVLASRRNLADLSIGPILSHTTEEILDHVNKLLKINGAKVLFGAKELKEHSIPKKYGAVEATAVFVPLHEIAKAENFALVTTEIFGPFQIITNYDDSQLPCVLGMLEKMDQHLTAAVVSNDLCFQQKILGCTVNGTTYVGIRGRTTGAPQNHWFGPAGDPRGAGIGTVEAIRLVWSCHREIIEDFGPVPQTWQAPKPT